MSATSNAPTPDDRHTELAVFLGRWQAEGLSYGSQDQTRDEPKGHTVPWVSTHTGFWHTGGYFLVQDERAAPGGETFDTLSIMGVSPDGGYFAQAYENHGFENRYVVTRDGDTWRFTNDEVRAVIRFEDEGRKQVIAWEWLRDGAWLPLCDRVAKRLD